MKLMTFGVGAIVLAVAAAVPPAAFAGAEKGLKLYSAHEFDKAIEECADSDKDVMSRLVLGLSHTEKYKLYKLKADKEQAAMYLKMLEVDVGIKDSKVIEKFLNIAGNPNGNKEAAGLLKKAFEKTASSPSDILLVAEFANPAKGVEANSAALRILKKRLGTVRDYVSDGATMPKDMQELFVRQELVEPLAAALEVKDTASDARKCLTIIEEPALKLLEEKPLTPSLSEAIVDIKKAINKRKTKYPNSTWYSASGK